MVARLGPVVARLGVEGVVTGEVAVSGAVVVATAAVGKMMQLFVIHIKCKRSGIHGHFPFQVEQKH